MPYLRAMFELPSNKGKIKNSSSLHIISKIACAPKHPKFLVCSRFNFITVPIITKVTCNINNTRRYNNSQCDLSIIYLKNIYFCLRRGGGVHPDFVELYFEIAVDQQTKAHDRTFAGFLTLGTHRFC